MDADGRSYAPKRAHDAFAAEAATPPKRPRVGAREADGDAVMGDDDGASAGDGRVAPAGAGGVPQYPASSPPTPAPSLLPMLRRVLSHVTAPAAGALAAPGALSLHMRSLRAHAPLREVCRAFRDAYDTHVLAWDFGGVERIGPQSVEIALTRVLPRLRNLSALALTPASTDRALVDAWRTYCAAAAAAGVRVRTLSFADAAVYSEVPEIVAALAAGNLEALHVITSGAPGAMTTTAILSSVAQYCVNVRALDALLDGVDLRVLAGFASLHVARLLFREGVSGDSMLRLTWALSQVAASLQSVDLRIHHLRSTSDALSHVAAIPRLRKLSLFSCSPPAPSWLAGCLYLSELQLEWLDDLSDVMVEELSRVIGPRLLSIRIWNCGSLTDYSLLALAQACPRTAVDLKFERPQFSPRAIAALPNCINCEAWGTGNAEPQPVLFGT